MSANDTLDKDDQGLLSDATLLALRLHHQPFSSTLRDASALPDDDGTDVAALPFSDAITEEQLADIKQALITGDDLLLILGEKGSGKTTLAQQLNANSGLRIQCFSVTGSDNFSTLNLFAGMLEAFQRNPPQKLKDILDELTPCLQSMAARNTLSVIVLDDAHKVNQTELTQLLSGMLYMNSQDETLMRVALAATPDFEDIIPDLLPEGADMPYSSLTIEGFSPPRAAAYLDYRLGLAGFDQEFPFTERDMASLVDHSDGRPAELHALTADVLNEKYGRLEEGMPQELMSNGDKGILSSRKSKLALGAIATVLILAGLLAFLPGGDKQDRSTSLQTIDVAEQKVTSEAPELKLINPGQSESDLNTQNSTESGSAVDAPQIEVIENPKATPVPENSESTQQSSSSSTDTDDNNDNPIAAVVDTVQTESSNAGNAVANETSAEKADDSQTITQDASSDISDAADEVLATAEEASSELATSELAVNDTAPAAPEAASDKSSEESSEPAASDPPAANTAPADNTSSEQSSADTTQVALADLVDPEIADLLESPNWILVQDENQFTIQMSASRDLPSVQNFLRRNTLPSPNSIFSFEREGEVWFALVHGIFPTFEDAQSAVQAMPAAAQKDTPWIRSIARVKEISRQ